MEITKSTKEFINESKCLEAKILQFKSTIGHKDNFLIFEKNYFDFFIDNTFNFIEKILIFLVNNLKIKKNIFSIILMIKKSVANILGRIFETNEKYSNSKLFEKRLDAQQKFIELSSRETSELKKDINKINDALCKLIENPNKVLNDNTPQNIGHNSTARVDFYQEENIRLSSELLDTKKKFDILKSELEKYQEQRSNIISKINSVNEAINDSNVLTNIFNNDIKPKVNVIDHNKLKTKEKNKDVLNEQVKNIFAK